MSPLVVLSLVSAAASGVVAVSTLRHRTALARAIVAGLLAAAWWSAAGAGAMAAGTPELATVLVDAVVLGTVGVIVAAGWYTAALLGRTGHPWWARLLVVEPVVVTAATLTDPWYHLVVGDLRLEPLRADPGPLLRVHVGYGLAVLVVASAMQLRAAWSAREASRVPHLAATAALAVPVVAVAVSVATADQHLQDYGGASLGLTALAFWWVDRSSVSLPRLPITTAETLQALPDAIVVSDPDGRIVSANEAAARLVGDGLSPGRPLLGANWADLVEPELLARLRASDHEVLVVGGRALDVRVTRLELADGVRQGAVTVIRDVSEVEQLRADLAELTVRDGLTGLHNRRHLDNVLGPLVHAAQASGAPLAAVMLDLDHFKQVNDSHGHAVGDEVLVAVARELAGCLRSQDVLVRFGGEEFLALLPATPVAVAASRAQECRSRVSALELRTSGPRLTVTLSAGVAVLHADADTLLREADDALYSAKLAGRDRVVVRPEPR